MFYYTFPFMIWNCINQVLTYNFYVVIISFHHMAVRLVIIFDLNCQPEKPNRLKCVTKCCVFIRTINEGKCNVIFGKVFNNAGEKESFIGKHYPFRIYMFACLARLFNFIWRTFVLDKISCGVLRVHLKYLYYTYYR